MTMLYFKFKRELGCTLMGFALLFMVQCQSGPASGSHNFPVLKGPYVGQTPPGNEPELFAPGIVTSGLYTRDLSMTPEGDQIFFCVSAYNFNLIFHTRLQNGVWSEPAPAPFIRDFQYMYYEPHVAPNGRKLLFLSNQPSPEREETNQDIWVVEKEGEGWGEPYDLGPPVSTSAEEYFPSMTRDGTIYFTRQEKGSPVGFIYRSRYIDGHYGEAEKLGPEVNGGTNRYNAFIDPDEEFIIVPMQGREDSYGSTDYYIVFRDKADNWSEPVNMGEKINTSNGREYSPYISPDGKYFFFMSTRARSVYESSKFLYSFRELISVFNEPANGYSDIYWVKADFIDSLRPAGF